MARAKTTVAAGYSWHIVLRTHQHKNLLHRQSDRRRCLYWMYQARRLLGLSMVNYSLTPSTLQLLIVDKGRGEVPCSLNLIANTFSEEFKRRHRHPDPLWELHYQATRLSTENKLLACSTEMDIAAVRQGLVDYPWQWQECGYAEIQQPVKRCRRIDYRSVLRLTQCNSVDALQVQNRQSVVQALQALDAGSVSEFTTVKKEEASINHRTVNLMDSGMRPATQYAV